MATFIKLAEDVAKVIEAEVQRHPGMNEEEFVNELVRKAFARTTGRKSDEPFRVDARPMGLREGFSYDQKVSEWIERAEGPWHR